MNATVVLDVPRQNTGYQRRSGDDWRLRDGAFSFGRAVFEKILDEIEIAVIVTDPNARVLYMNAAAEQLVDTEIGLTVSHGILQAGCDEETAELRVSIKKLIQDKDLAVGQRCVVAVNRYAELERQAVVIRRLSVAGSSDGAQDTSQAVAALFVTQRNHGRDVSPDVLKILFGLTSSEAALTSHLIEGTGLKPAAEKSSMGINTARTHLKKIFAKTQTKRQAELVRLISDLIGVVRYE